ncbi:hypothetical protein [Streptomyces sp. NPDC049585]|uniref:hypothetical protein n=1 Tax=Streptomyces sp. NPDC049585 TaxID=3155154 RepID=UPI00341D450C
MTLFDVAAQSQEATGGSDFFVSGSSAEVAALCRERSPGVGKAIADSLARSAPDRAVVRIRIGHPTTGRPYGIDSSGLIDSMTAIGDLRRHWASCPVDHDGSTVRVRGQCGTCGRLLARRVRPEVIPKVMHCAACGGSDAPGPVPAALPELTLEGLRVLVDTGLFDVLYGGSRECAVGRYDGRWKDVLIGENTRDEDETIPIPPETPLPLTCPQRLGFVARNDTLYDIASTAISVARTPAMLAFTEVCYGYLWCMFDSGVTCEKCVDGLSAQSMYATFAEYYHFMSDVNESLGELSRATAQYIQHCLTDHPDSALCQVMDSFVLATQAVYLDVLHPKATELRVDGDEAQALRYRMLNSGARTITLFNLLEGTHNGVVTSEHVEAVTMMMFSVHDALDRRCDVRGNEANNFFTIVAAHNGTESAELLGRFCTDVLAWAVDKQSMWPLLTAGRLLLWQIHCYRYRSVEILDHLKVTDHPVCDPYQDQVLNAFNPLLQEGGAESVLDVMPADRFSVRARCSNRAWYDRQVGACLDHFATCRTCNGYDRASWAERATRAQRAYLRKQAGDCGCVDAMAVYSSLVLLGHVWWAAHSTAEYTGPTGDRDPFLV